MGTGRYVPVHAVARPALLRRLDAALSRPVTLVVAQAGAGKSVLLTQWLQTVTLAVVWLDITDADNDAEHFVRHLRRNIAQPAPGVVDDDPTVALAGPVLAPQLVDDLVSAMATAPPCVVVLDDLHNLHDTSLLTDLGKVLTLLPPHVHVVLSSRTDPPIPWGRSRLREDLGELRQAELAMNDRESATLLQGVSGVTLGDAEVTALVQRTEGWAAGLQLAAMTLRHHPDPAAFVAQFSGSDRLVADYLSEQVVQSLSDDLRALLFSMAAVDRMSDDLVAHISDDPGARSALHELQQTSMFLIPLDDHREWFRFHQLFRDLLRYQSRSHDPKLEHRALVRAAEWHLARDEWEPAVLYLLRGREWNRATGVILARGSEVFERGEIASVISVIAQVPEPVREANVDLTLLLGILIGITGRAERAEDVLRRVTADAQATPGQQVCAATFLAALAQWRAHPEASISWAQRALASLRSDTTLALPDILHLTDAHSLRTMATVSGGRAHFLAGDLDEARVWLQSALLTQGSAYSLWRISALGSLALLEAWVGHSSLAEELALEALSVAQSVNADLHPATAEAHLALGLTALESGDERRAAHSMDEGWLRSEGNGRTPLNWVFYAASRGLSRPPVDRARPPGRPPAIAAERIAAINRRGVHPGGWVAAKTDTIAAAQRRVVLEDGTGRPAAPLTDRELEILAFLPTRLSSGDLAAHLHVSANTIKTHIAHIYQKLGVANRSEAVTRATQLGLLRW